MNRFVRAAVAFAALSCACASWAAEERLTLVVPFAAGSASDQLARGLAQSITAQTGRPVVVDNKPGASGILAAQAVAKAAPDGNTLFITSNTTQAANPHLFKQLPYDPVADLAPITELGRGGMVMVVNVDSPHRTLADVLAKARREPGKTTFASGSSSSRLGGELLQQLAKVEMTHVPYKSNPQAITDLLGGQFDFMFTDTSTGLPQVKAGKLRALAVSTGKRSPLLPDVATVAEQGITGYEIGYWFAAYAPARTPAATIEKLNRLLAVAVRSESLRSFYAGSGTEPTVSSPEGLRDFQARETVLWGKIIRAAGIQPE